MGKARFRLVGFDEDGVKGKPENRRLVCIIEGNGKLAIWGHEQPARNMQNIETVLNAGIPCTVECEYREPSRGMSEMFGHTYWVAQDHKLRIVAPGGVFDYASTP